MRFEDFLTQELGEPKENTIGELRYCCPFCGEKSYKFYVKQALDSSNGQYHCKKCDESGNPITFMKTYYNITGKQAFDLLESKNIDIEKASVLTSNNKDLTESEKLILMLRGVHQENKNSIKPPKLPVGFKLIKDNLNNKEIIPFLKYLKGRGITLNQIINNNIGYVINGYFYKSDGETKAPLRNSIIFFTYDNEGKYQYWNTRSIDKNPYIKSINAPAKQDEVGRKDIIFNLNIARKKKFLVITEGVFDALTFHEYGVATLGKQVTDNQVQKILDSVDKDTSIYIMLDTDALDNNIDLAYRLKTHFNKVYFVPHGDEDANDMGTKKAFELLQSNRVLVTPESIQSYKIQQKLKL